ncbi:MAG: CRISPR-associated endonuclease Cas2 [Pleomorphochaeta sp.]
MRLILVFDLPTLTIEQRRDYRIFRKWLIKEGFIMLQESVYSKLALNNNSSKLIIENVKKHKTLEGSIQIFEITEKEFNNREIIVGTSQNEVLDTMEKVVII